MTRDMTTKKAKADRRKPAAKDPPRQQKTVLEITRTRDPEHVATELSKSVPGWADLSDEQQREFVALTLDYGFATKPVTATLTRQQGGHVSVSHEGETEALSYLNLLKVQKAFGAASMDTTNARTSELLKYLGSIGADTTSRYNAALSFIESMGPKDQAEVLLLVQMYCTHDAAIRALSQIGRAEWVPQMQTFGNLAAKLMRISQGQMETLARMRRGGEQVVRHVHVDNRGGQAVIAETVHAGGQGNARSDEQSRAAGSAGLSPAMLGADPLGFGMPVSSREGEATMQNARRHEPRGSEG